MRCFIAVDISEEIRRTLDNFVQPLRNLSRGIKWVSSENIHLTLKFLGEVSETALPQISDALADVALRHRSFSITLKENGAFPSIRRPQVLWIGLQKSDELADLCRDVDVAMATQGFKREERDFSPHLTIGRVRDGHGIERVVDEFSAGRHAVFGSIDVKAFALKESILRPAGPLYRDLFVFTFSRRNQDE